MTDPAPHPQPLGEDWLTWDPETIHCYPGACDEDPARGAGMAAGVALRQLAGRRRGVCNAVPQGPRKLSAAGTFTGVLLNGKVSAKSMS